MCRWVAYFGNAIPPEALLHDAEHSRRHGVAEPLRMTAGLSDGERVHAARYASGPVVNSLYVTAL